MRRAAGFSLIELLMAVLIAGIVAAIAIPVFNGQRDGAKDHAAQQDLERGYRTLRHVQIDEALPASGLAAKLGAAEPTGTFADGTAFTAGQVNVERVSATRATLRTKSRSGAEMLLATDTDTGETVRARSKPNTSLQPLSNLIPNPSMEIDTATWGLQVAPGQTGTLTRTSAWSAAGSYSILLSVDTPAASGSPFDVYALRPTRVSITAGAKYTCQAKVKVLADTGSGAACWLWFYDSGGAYITGSVSAFPGVGSKTVFTTATAPANATSFRTAVGWWQANPTQTAQMYIDAASVTATDRALAYFDGDTPGASWTGTAHNSASTGYPDDSVLG